MDSLPSEIIHCICQILSKIGLKHVRNFRLVSRRMADISACYGLPRLVFYLHESDFKALRTISKHPIIPKYVKSLVYSSDRVERSELNEVFDDYKHSRRDDIPDLGHASPRRRKKAHQAPKLTMRQLVTHCQKIKTYSLMQDDLLSREEDYDTLEEIIPSFPNLHEIVVATEAWSWGCKTRRSPFNDGIMEFIMTPELPSGCRALTAMLKAIPPSCTSIRTLRAGSVSWQFFRDNEALPQLLDLAANLTVIELHLTANVFSLDEDNLNDAEVQECRNEMGKGVLKEVLRAAKNLESLDFQFDEYDGDTGVWPAVFQDIIGPGQHWPNLRKLRIGSLDSERILFEPFIRRHMSTLQELTFFDIKFPSSSWLPFFQELKRMHTLSDIKVLGIFEGLNEENHIEEYWDLGETMYDPVNKCRDDLGGLLGKWLLDEPQGAICPLDMARGLVPEEDGDVSTGLTTAMVTAMAMMVDNPNATTIDNPGDDGDDWVD